MALCSGARAAGEWPRLGPPGEEAGACPEGERAPRLPSTALQGLPSSPDPARVEDPVNSSLFQPSEHPVSWGKFLLKIKGSSCFLRLILCITASFFIVTVFFN